MKMGFCAKSLSSLDDCSNQLAMSHYSYIQPFGTIEVLNGLNKRLRHKDSYQDIYNEKKFCVNYGISLPYSFKMSRSADSFNKRRTFSSYNSLDNTKAATLAKGHIKEDDSSKSGPQRLPPVSFFHGLSMQNMLKATMPAASNQSSSNPLTVSQLSNEEKGMSKSHSLTHSVKLSKEKNKGQNEKGQSLSSSLQKLPTNLNIIFNSSHQRASNKPKHKGSELNQSLQANIRLFAYKSDLVSSASLEKAKPDKKDKVKGGSKQRARTKIEKVQNIKLTDVYKEEKRQREEYELNKRKIDEDTLKTSIIQQEKKKIKRLKKSFASRANLSNSLSKSKSKSKSKSPHKTVQSAKLSKKTALKTKTLSKQPTKSPSPNQLASKKQQSSSTESIHKKSPIEAAMKKQANRFKDKTRVNQLKGKEDKIAEVTGYFNPISNSKQSLPQIAINEDAKRLQQKNNTDLTGIEMDSTNIKTKKPLTFYKEEGGEDLAHQSNQLKSPLKHSSPTKAKQYLSKSTQDNQINEIIKRNDIITLSKLTNSPLNKVKASPNKPFTSKESLDKSSCEEVKSSSLHKTKEVNINQISEIQQNDCEKKIENWFDQHQANDSTNKPNKFYLKAQQIKDKLTHILHHSNSINSNGLKENNIDSPFDPLFKNNPNAMLSQSYKAYLVENDPFYKSNKDNEANKNSYLSLVPNHYIGHNCLNHKTIKQSPILKGLYIKPQLKKSDSYFSNKPFSQRLNSLTKDTDTIMPSNPFDSVVKAREFFFFD